MKTNTTVIKTYIRALLLLSLSAAASALLAAGFGIKGWPESLSVVLFAVGLMIGSVTRFKNPLGYIGMLSGIFFVTNAEFPHLHIILYLWPALILSGIVWGISIKRNRFKWNDIRSLYNHDNDLTAA